jgi:alkylhydroperoxidase family enzyme
VIDLLAEGKIEEAQLPESEKALLRVVELITKHAYRMTPERIQTLRDHGWTEPQIAEMVYITAMFAFFNRVADAFGIDSQGYGGPRPQWEKLESDSVTIAASDAA